MINILLSVLQHTLPFHTQQSHADLPSGQIQPLLPSFNPRIWLRRRGTCRADGRIGIGGMRMMHAWEAVE